MSEILLPALVETIYMSLVSTFFAIVIGFILAIILILTSSGGLRENQKIYSILDVIINTLRSFPFIILMIVLFPLTKFLIGKSIGTTAAIIPLTIGAAPFIARLIESALKEVDTGVVEAAKSFGASDWQIIFKVMCVEALPSIISAITLTLITVIGFSAMAGAVGGGGLGDVAIKYGYYRFQSDTMIYTVIVLIALVQGVQSLGDYLYKITKK
ncbi:MULTISPECIES: methionine ABC transporter permease [unclassified Arcobacter]|jgi:D-methionine transport system permease protein|uniref:methionine ABC transporter permease n=1 Tax=Arcobacter TaxID=28196 RepID=UPI0035D52374|tara:strand:- start:1244 stop:1882 length:639 start_codon:yes stop_codon:yes gene_type:complete